MFYRKQNQKHNDRNASGPAIMMMPPHIRATFMPNPPISYIQPPNLKGDGKDKVELIPLDTQIMKKNKNKNVVISDDESSSDEEERTFFSRNSKMKGMSSFMNHFEKVGKPPKRLIGKTPKKQKLENTSGKKKINAEKLKPLIEKYRSYQKESNGECNNMNCYNTLYVGRLAYETTERKLLREFEVFGPIKDLKLVHDSQNTTKSKGYAFVEYEHEEDMKRAYRAADALKIDGKEVVVDVERGHTVPNWLPRRLNGGLGGTRLGGADRNVTLPGRFDPSKQSVAAAVMQQQQQQHHQQMMMRGAGPPQGMPQHLTPQHQQQQQHGLPPNMMRGGPNHMPQHMPYGSGPPMHHRRDNRGPYAPGGPPMMGGGGGGGGQQQPPSWDRRMGDHHRPGGSRRRSRSRSPPSRNRY